MTPATRSAIDAVSAAFGIPADRVLAPSRERIEARTRWAALAILAAAGYSLSHIGREFGMDHTSVMNAVTKARTLDPAWRAKLAEAAKAAAIPPVAKPTTPAHYEKFVDGAPTPSNNKAVADRCAEAIRRYWGARGVEVEVGVEPVPIGKKQVVWRVRSAGIPLTPGGNQ